MAGGGGAEPAGSLAPAAPPDPRPAAVPETRLQPIGVRPLQVGFIWSQTGLCSVPAWLLGISADGLTVIAPGQICIPRKWPLSAARDLNAKPLWWSVSGSTTTAY